MGANILYYSRSRGSSAPSAPTYGTLDSLVKTYGTAGYIAIPTATAQVGTTSSRREVITAEGDFVTTAVRDLYETYKFNLGRSFSVSMRGGVPYCITAGISSFLSSGYHELIIKNTDSGSIVDLVCYYANSSLSVSSNVVYMSDGRTFNGGTSAYGPFAITSNGEYVDFTSYVNLNGTYGRLLLREYVSNNRVSLSIYPSSTESVSNGYAFFGGKDVVDVSDASLSSLSVSSARTMQLYLLENGRFSSASLVAQLPYNEVKLTSSYDPWIMYTPRYYEYKKAYNSYPHLLLTESHGTKWGWDIPQYLIDFFSSAVSGPIFCDKSIQSSGGLEALSFLEANTSAYVSTALAGGAYSVGQTFALTYPSSTTYLKLRARSTQTNTQNNIHFGGDQSHIDLCLKSNDTVVTDSAFDFRSGTSYSSNSVIMAWTCVCPPIVQNIDGSFTGIWPSLGIYIANALSNDNRSEWYFEMGRNSVEPGTSNLPQAYYQFLTGSPPSTGPGSDDPYDPGGPSTPGGGGGNFDDSSDPAPLPSLPTISATDCGMTTVYQPTRDELISLGRYLWSDTFSVDTLKKLFADPMQILIGLNILPFTPSTSGTKTLKVGGFSTGISMKYMGQQYHEIDCGSVSVEEYWGSALDYNPYTKTYLYLPHIGTVEINTDLVMKADCQVVYRVDVMSGACLAALLSNGNVVGHWTGQVANNIPLSGADYSRVIAAIMGVAGTAIAAGVAVGGAGALASGAIGGAAELGGALGTPISEIGAGLGQIGATMAGQQALTPQVARGMTSLASGIALGTGGLVSQVTGAKVSVQLSGQISGHVGIMDIPRPHFIFIRPKQSLAENYRHYMGYPSNVTASVESCKGFTQFESIEIKNVDATDPEIAEIVQILKGGFYG